jgi:phosphoribosylaminoimidazolecarboxamide formyltransferase/IMP cyclohydrolase
MNVPVRRALLSVSDKTGVVALGQALHSLGCEIVSTGGTARALREAGLPVTDITAVSGNPEAFGGRMKTISFAVESALLFHRERDAAEAQRLGIVPIDLVACNLYPFERAWKGGGDMDALVENIDIGGPTMLRAAAKNFHAVAALCDPADYPAIIAELEAQGGATTLATRQRLMRKVFDHTADYDAAIAMAMAEQAGDRSIRLAYDTPKPLRYGENSHQQAAFYRQRGAAASMHDLEILGGKPLSYNNIVDTHAALETAVGLAPGGVAIIKHTNPCGLAVGRDQLATFGAAWAGDPLSSFGSVIAFNTALGLETARFLNLHAEKVGDRKFVEVVAAPAFEAEVVDYLRRSQNLRIVRYEPEQIRQAEALRLVPGGLLVQDADVMDLGELQPVTRVERMIDQELLRFGVAAVRQVKSNAIVVVRRRQDGVLQLLGMGAGQPNRVNSTGLSLERARLNLTTEAELLGADPAAHTAAELGRAYLVSDAFFPFPDNVEVAAEAGVRHLFQPGGSIRDKAVIRRCDELGLSMVFTGLRHFKH